MGLLDGKAIVITGAGSGLGAAYARHCAALGARLVVNDVDAAAAGRIASGIVAAGGTAVASAGSVASWDYAGELVAACVGAFGRIDGLLNNAGILRHGRVTEMTERDLRAMLEVNTIGAAACAAHAIRRMLEQDGHGSIVNVASGSQAGDIALGAYGASKAAVASLTFSWALELRDTKVRVNALSPLAHTAMAETNMKFLAQQSASREVVYTTLPAADVNAPAAAFLLSDRSIGINGQIVRIAGEELSFVTHPMIAEPVLKGRWDDDAVEAAFRDTLGRKQQKLGLAYARTMVS
jgi:NAD(P)-dependent dehydrogenase (short-subunit alcohol dehydrogenase family)